MIKKIIEISQQRTALSIRHGQLILKTETGQNSIPCEDIGILLVDNPATVYTHSVFTELLKAGAAVVLCGNDHLPSGCLLPIESNSIQTQRIAEQIKAKEPLRKNLWQQIVRAKIRHQAKIVRDNTSVHKGLMELISQVRSGDVSNVEARASKIFWGAYLQSMDESVWAEAHPTDFKRNREGKPPNNLLNYGYMVMRAAVARAICSAGLLPSVGLHHKNKYNAFCLADDLIEPFRGYVEIKVKEIVSGGEWEELTQSVKARLLETLYEEVEIADYKGPLMVGLHRVAASLVRCFGGEQKEIDLPKL
ncbi:MAG: CRISPR-associated endonuclease Cas1 [bacterium ADurb.Bin157]|nr:MAG: CRISPR-associated endonuclease Cas1 [bacterium ADurb.Bin157]